MYAWKSASGREKIKSMEGKNVECHECGCIKKDPHKYRAGQY